MAMIEVLARAKVNLTLHVTGQRDDGYHLLDSLVAFASVGDTIRAEAAPTLGLTVDGPFADDISTMDNLVLDAARFLDADRGADLAITKRLPVASGIGGGSADAAATMRALSTLWGVPVPDNTLPLGADVPVCLQDRAVRMKGVGEQIAAVSKLPQVPAVLVNPMVPVATSDVFKALTKRDNAPMPEVIPSFETVLDLATWLDGQRNDLQVAAISLVPEIQTCLDALGRGLIARMSGSGATCFGLFATPAAATAEARRIAEMHPDLWIATCELS